MKFRSLQYNIFARSPKFLFPNDKHTERLSQIPKFVQSIEQQNTNDSIDIISFCEANEMDSVSDMVSTLRKQGFIYNSNILGYKTKLYKPRIQSTCTDVNISFRGKFSIDVINGGVLVLRRHEIVREINYMFKNYVSAVRGYGFDGFARKGFIYVKIRKKRENKSGYKYIHVISTHLQAWPGKEYDRIRLPQIKEMYSEIKKLNIPDTEPAIFQGDFNVDYFTAHKEFKKICRHLNATLPMFRGKQLFTSDPTKNYFVGLSGENSSCYESYQYCLQHRCLQQNRPFEIIQAKQKLRKIKNTDTKSNKKIKNILTLYKKPKHIHISCECCPQELLDYILYSGHIKYASMQILVTQPIFKKNGEVLELSDHYPILGRFTIQSN